MLDLSDPELKFAIKAVREASSLAKQVQSEMTADELTKGDRSPVTVADFAVQALVAQSLEQEFPRDILVAEENSDVLRSDQGKPVLEQVMEFAERFIQNATHEKICDWIDRGKGEPADRFWTLDPIDGTKGFLRGEQYAVGLSLIQDYQLKLAVIGCPNLSTECHPDLGGYGALAIAVRGQGAWITSLKEDSKNLDRLHVSDQSNFSKARLLRSVESAHTNTSRTAAILKENKNEVEPIQMDSLAKYVSLAGGEGDLFFYLLPRDNPKYRMKIWDVAPGALVVEEAGGRITDLEGQDIDYSMGITIAKNPGLLMSNGKLHEKGLETLRQVQ